MKTCAIIGLENWGWDYSSREKTARKTKLRFEVVLEKLILQGFCRFLIGNNGFVDKIVVKVLEKLKKSYPQIEIQIFDKKQFAPNINEFLNLDDLEGQIKLLKQHEFYMQKVTEINKEMLKKCNYVVHCFVEKGIEMSDYVYDYVLQSGKEHFCIDWL